MLFSNAIKKNARTYIKIMLYWKGMYIVKQAVCIDYVSQDESAIRQVSTSTDFLI